MGRSLPSSEESTVRKGAAWGVHILTATGAAVGLMAIIAIAHGKWELAFAWMAVTLFIDSIDGSLARKYEVKEVLPQIDGALLDNIVDYFTYAIIPAFFLYESGVVPPRWGLVGAMAITFASGYQFCQAEAKTEDHFFRGFPSYWNVVVFYFFMLGWSPWTNLLITLALAVAIFIPVKYLYPSRTRQLRFITIPLTAIWGVMLAIALVRYPEGHLTLARWSLAYVGYYFAASITLTLKGIRSRE